MFPRHTKQTDTVFIEVSDASARDSQRLAVSKQCRDYTKLRGISPAGARTDAARLRAPAASMLRGPCTPLP
ncbi:hypothetical protein BN2475_1060010 [Paraburkholderia ribeironis]|uniref:Uncharacterized protein n=1 Tax=Paraburkholderia ribeironis TaxID=1247936 RepID=A0A1N7SMG8_9BURK|nr:hypothetical protein BN2475_1060010 [Paraburkholderia ribeironis]